MVVQRVSSVTKPLSKKSYAKILIAAGGAFQSCVKFWSDADLVVYVDVAAEVEAADARAGTVVLRVAQGETLSTLAAKIDCPQALRDFIRQYRGVRLSIGIEALRGAGYLAVQALLADPAFLAQLRELFDKLLIIHNGEITELIIQILNSGAGATGSTVGRPVAAAIAKAAQDLLDPIITIKQVFAGSMSYVGVGERVHENAAAALAESVAFVTAEICPLRQLREMTCIEFPMCELDKVQRDAYVAQFAQAYDCPDVREHIDRPGANAATSRLGAIGVGIPGYFTALPEADVASEIAGGFISVLKTVRDTPPRAQENVSIRVDLDTHAGPAPSIEDFVTLVKLADRVEPLGFLDTCASPGVAVAGSTVWAEYSRKALRFSERDFTAAFSTPAGSRFEFITKIGLLRAINHTIASEIARREGDVQTLEPQRVAHRAALAASIKDLFPRKFFKRVTAKVAESLAGKTARLAEFKSSVNTYREGNDRLVKLQAELEALRDAQRFVQAELQRETERLAAVITALVGIHFESIRTERLVVADEAQLDAVFDEMVRLAESGGELRSWVRLVASSVQQVTMAGLARIAGAVEPTAVSIARRLTQPAPVMAPAWGGRRPDGAAVKVVVLPPVARGLFEAVAENLKKLGYEGKLAMAEQARSGINVVTLDFYKPDIHGLFTPLIRKNLDEALLKPHLTFTMDPGPVLAHLRALGLPATATIRQVEQSGATLAPVAQ